MQDESRRTCSLAAALRVIGEKWSLLVIRELCWNVHRFDAIAGNTGAPRDILTSRLRRLEATGVIEKRLYQERPARYEYHLTVAGEELRPVLLSLMQWGDRWANPEPTLGFVHTCGEEVELVHTCRACGEEVTGRDLRAKRLAPASAPTA